MKTLLSSFSLKKNFRRSDSKLFDAPTTLLFFKKMPAIRTKSLMLVTLLIGAIFLTNTARAQQDIQVSTATTALTSGVSSFDFGDVMIDYPVIYSFIVENVGDADLTLASVTFGGADPAVFSSEGLASQDSDGTTVLAAGEIDVFTISFIPVASGMKSTIVTVESDDPDEGSFTFTVAGNAIDKPASCIIPNGGFEFSNTVALPQLDFFASTASGVTEYETPAGWSSAFGIVAALFGLDVNVSITADARTGSGALELVGDGTNFGDVLTALPCSASQAPATLQGYYKFTGAPTDSAMIAVSTGGGEMNSDTLYIDSDASTYTMFQIDFPYDANSVDSLLVHIFTTNNGVSTVFKVDDLEITMAPGAADENPIFVSSNSASYAENGTGTVLDIDANDGDGGAVDAGITYSLSGGADQAEFDIDVNNGALTFISSPDFENPTDANADNAYIVQVTANDGVNTTDQTVTITVTDVVDETITGISDNVESDNLRLYPNPVSSSFGFSDPELKIHKVIVYSLEGGLLKQFKNRESRYDVSDLKVGTYIIRVKSDGRSYFQRMIKN